MPEPPPPVLSSLRSRLPLLVALVLSAAVLWRALGGQLVYDDLLLVGRNPLIADPGHLPELFLRPYWGFLRPGDSAQIGYWRPLTAAALTLGHALGGGAPEAFHALALLVHLAATAVAWSLARRLSGSEWVAFAAALLFGLHPVHVESVAWISALNDPLFGLFTLLALDRYLAWRERGSRGIPWAAALAFVPALLAKELAGALLPLLVAVDLGRRRCADEEPGPLGGLGRPLAAYVPFALVLLGYLVMRMVVFGSLWAGFDRTTTDFGVSAGRLALLRVEMLGGTLELLSWPVRLALFRPFRPDLAFTSPAALLALACIALWAAATVLAWRRRHGPALVALLFVPAGLLPALLRVQSLGRFPLSDRFLYLPVFGFALLAALLFARLLPRGIATVALLVVAALYGLRDFTRIGDWRDEEHLFRVSARQAPRSVYVQWGLGRVLLERYNELHDPDDLKEAFDVYERAKDLLVEARSGKGADLFVTSRDFLQVNLGSGWCHLLAAEHEPYEAQLALEVFQQVKKAVDEVRKHESEAAELGIRVRSADLEVEEIDTALGAAHMQLGDLDAARKDLEHALQENPRYPEAHQTLGRLHSKREEWEDAVREFSEAARLRPTSFEDRLLLAQAAYQAGDTTRAEDLAEKLCEERPDVAEPFVLRATIELSRNDTDAALRWVDRALQANPTHGYAWYQRGNALARRNSWPEAVEAYWRAAELLPGNFEAHYDLGALLLRMDRKKEAIGPLVRAYGLSPSAQMTSRLRPALEALPFDTPQPLFELASIDRSRGALQDAMQWVERGLRIDPDDGDTLFLKGRLLQQLGRSDEALDLMQRGAARLPDSFVAHSELGGLLAEKGHADEAIRELEKALALGPPAGWTPDQAKGVTDLVRRQLEKLRAGGKVTPAPAPAPPPGPPAADAGTSGG